LPKNYLLYVGGRNEYKNFIFFIKAIAKILQNDTSLFLVCAGGGSFSEIEKKTIFFIES